MSDYIPSLNSCLVAFSAKFQGLSGNFADSLRSRERLIHTFSESPVFVHARIIPGVGSISDFSGIFAGFAGTLSSSQRFSGDVSGRFGVFSASLGSVSSLLASDRDYLGLLGVHRRVL